MEKPQDTNDAAGGQSRLTDGLGAWISMEDTIPENGQTILGFWSPPQPTHSISGKNYGVATRTGTLWHNPVDEGEEYVSPTHWMPLPKAPNYK